ncbi:translocation/assembly module TamB domain-containing protein [Geminicoccaceae bacterium 1502E]|nr:translocation/assembly module TamB domain-containing protein [Geminicoccaceae bacterium 1502E]
MLRKLLYGLLAAFLVIVVLLAGAFAYAQTGMAKGQIAQLVEGQLSQDGQKAEVEELSGFLPFDIRLGRLRLADEEGAWLEVDGARVKLAPSALLGSRVVVEQVGAERVALQRLPPAAPAAEPPAEDRPFELPILPELPESLPSFEIGKLEVGRIELGAPVLGQPATFRLEGSAGSGPEGRRLTADLDLRRIDQETAALTLDATLDLAERRLALDVQGSETGGLLAAATGRPEAEGLTLRLQGDGPLADWRGRLDLDAEKLATLDTELAFGWQELPRLALDGRFAAAPGVLPAELAPLLGEQVSFAARLQPTSAERVALEELRLEAAGFSLTGGGAADLGADTLEGRAVLEVPKLAAASGAAGTALAGSAELRLEASGSPGRPALDLVIAGRGLGAEDFAAETLDGRLALRLAGSLDEGFPGASLEGEIDAKGLSQGGQKLQPSDELRLMVDLEAPPEGPVDIHRLTLEGGPLNASLAGAIDPVTLAGKLRLEAGLPDIAALREALAVAEPPVTGSASLGADVTLEGGARRILASLVLDTSALAGLPPGAAEALGPAPKLEADLVYAADQAVEVSRLVLDAAKAKLDGRARLGLPGQELAGQIDLALPELAAFSDAAGQPLGGSATLTANLAGTLEQPSVKLSAVAENVVAAERQLARITLDADAAGPADALAGKARLTAQSEGHTLSLESRYALAGDSLSLDGLALSAPQTRLGGELEIDLASLLASGRLEGAVESLAALAPWHGQKDLAGSLRLDTRLEADQGRQDARIELAGSKLAGSFGSIASVRLNGSGRDLLGAPAVDATLGLESFVQNELVLGSASVEAKGPVSALDLTVTARGSQAQAPFDITARARVAALDEAKRVELASLEGSYDGRPVKLRAPATIVLDKGVLDIDQLDLQVGEARLKSRAQLGDGKVDAELRLEPTPLQAFEPFGLPPARGTAQATLSVTGRSDAPSATLELRIAELRPEGIGQLDEKAAADLALDAAIAQGRRLTAELRLTGPTSEPLVGQVALPLQLSLEPFAFALPEDTALSGTLTGSTQLARLAALVPLDGQRVAGKLALDMKLAGTLSAPAATGGLTLDNGTIEDADTGILLKNVRLDLRAEPNRLRIATLEARTRNDGQISGGGEVALDGAFPYRLRIDLENAELLRNQIGTALVSGDLSLEGDSAAAKAKGGLTIDRANLYIPEGGGGSAPPVIEVREAGDARDTAARKGNGGSGFVTRLDVKISMPARIFVRGRGLESEWGGELRVRGTASQPQIVGEIRFRRGFLDFLDRRFDIREGVITFDGAQPPVPRIELTAAAKAGDMTGIVRVQGPADAPKITLESEPPMPRDEVLSRLLFNRDPGSITPLQAAQLAAAVSALEGGRGLDVLGRLRDATGLDTIDVGDDGSGQTSARAGKYLSDNVYLEVQQGITPDSGKARVEIELTPNLKASTELDENSQSGVRLEWSMDY